MMLLIYILTHAIKKHMEHGYSVVQTPIVENKTTRQDCANGGPIGIAFPC